MEPVARTRDPEAERLERDAYSLLLHVYTRANASPETRILESDLPRAPGVEPEHAARVIRFLSRERLLHHDSSGASVAIALPGIAYIAHLAWRRCSVRRRWS